MDPGVERHAWKAFFRPHPKWIGIMGVSASRKNFGRIILQNIIANGFDLAPITIIRSGVACVDGIGCLRDLSASSVPLDLLVVAVDVSQVPDIVSEVIDRNATRSVDADCGNDRKRMAFGLRIARVAEIASYIEGWLGLRGFETCDLAQKKNLNFSLTCWRMGDTEN
jgi:hypothetical protein